MSKHQTMSHLLHAAGDLIPDCDQENVEEELVGFSWNIVTQQQHLVVAALHDILRCDWSE